MKKILSLLLVLALILSNIPMLQADAKLSLKDLITLGKKHWAYDTIIKLANAKIIGGMPDGTYKPDKPITREEFVKLIVEALQLEKSKRVSFEDIGGRWSQSYIETAVKEGIIIPSEVGKSFRPIDPITRYDAAYMIARGLKIEPYKVWNPPTGYPYQDTVDSTVAKLYAEYLLNGSIRDGMRYFDGSRSMTRAEAAVVIDRVMEYHKDKAAFKAAKKAEFVNAIVKAEKDAEFESFINSEAARQYASIDLFGVKDGVVTFKEYGSWDNGDLIPQTDGYKNLNKDVYNLIKTLTYYARKNDHYVAATYNPNGAILIRLYEDRVFGENMAQLGNFNMKFYISPINLSKAKQPAYVMWDLSCMWQGRDFTDMNTEIPAINFTQDKFLQPLQASFKTVYGDSIGQKLYEYAVKEYRLDNTSPLGVRRLNTSLMYFNDIEVKNLNDDISLVTFTTSVKK